MRLPRRLLRFIVTIYVAAVAYLICLLLLWHGFLAGGYLLLLSSQVALVALVQGGPRKPFWIIFGMLATAMFAALMLGFRELRSRVGWWPHRLYRGYRWFLWSAPPAVTDWLLAHVYVPDPQNTLSVWHLVLILELCYGLPLCLLCLIVAMLVERLRRASMGRAARLGLAQP